MTAEKLIELLKKLPPNTKLYLDGHEYKDDYRPVWGVTEKQNLGWGMHGVLIR